MDPGETVTCTFVSRQLGTIKIIKDAQPNDARDFLFSGDLGSFRLDDDSDPVRPRQLVFEKLPGRYKVTEAAASGWALEAITCADSDNGTTVRWPFRTATVDLDAGQAVTCTFRNKRLP